MRPALGADLNQTGQNVKSGYDTQRNPKAAQIGSMNTLYDQHGHRKYLTPAERDAFLKAADESEVREVRTFCATLAYTGCRISEALALTADRIDLKDGAIRDLLSTRAISQKRARTS